MELAGTQLVQFLRIIEDIGVDGYSVYLYHSQGNSLQETAQKFRMSRAKVQRIIKKCIEKRYGIALKELNMLK